jgi:hypothetical protein
MWMWVKASRGEEPEQGGQNKVGGPVEKVEELGS